MAGRRRRSSGVSTPKQKHAEAMEDAPPKSIYSMSVANLLTKTLVLFVFGEQRSERFHQPRWRITDSRDPRAEPLVMTCED